MIRTTVAVLFLAVPALTQKLLDCSSDFGNATFDPQALYRADSPYIVTDTRNNGNDRFFRYYYQICGAVTLPYPSLEHTCNITDGDAGPDTLTGPSSAFQIDSAGTTEFCHRLASDPNDPANMGWSLYDIANPARGIVLTYTHGDQCGYGGRDRSLKVWMECTGETIHSHSEMVQETDTCEYEIFMKSAYACPLECGITVEAGETKVCSRNGVCGFDRSISKSRCFCNPGFHGFDCSQTPDHSSGISTAAAVLIFVCVLLIVVLGGLVHVWRKISKLRLDPAAYSMLRGGQEDDDVA